LAERFLHDPLAPVPIPAPVPLTEGVATLPEARLRYADSGGGGEPVIFLHAAPGADHRLWSYQQKAFVDAGYRIVFYARRGYLDSGPDPRQSPGIAAEDLDELGDFLKLGKFHLVANAGGGAVAADYALSHPERLRSLTIANNYAGVRKGYIREAGKRCHPEQWTSLPRWFRNFSCSYRIANPEGVEAFLALEEKAAEHEGPPYGSNHVIDEKKLEELRVPTLLITGDADMSTPPALMRMVARHIRGSELVIIGECGHSPYWEHPRLFNRVVLEFLAEHRG
jgi:pimeloyl-ACP methyl ester carboxylesterase